MRLKFKSLTRECLLRPHQLADIMESKRDTGTRRHLLTFPLELYLKLFSDLEPLELLQLSQTCKQLHETLSDKQIWKTALRKMCSQEHLFEPSFPIEEMEVGDMQRAALGPTLWKNKVHRHAKLGPNHPLPYVERSFGGDYEPGLRREVIFTDTHIVPGGRYLLSSSTKFITLWDLGPPLTALRQTPRVVDTLSLEGTGWYVRRLDPPIIQTSSLRFGAQVSDWLSTDITYKVFEIGPLPEDVCIREIWKPQIAGVSYAFIQVNNWFYLVDWSFVAVMKNNFISLCDISHENIFSAALVIPCPEDLGQTKVPTSVRGCRLTRAIALANVSVKIAMVNGYLVALTNDNDVVLWIVSELQSSLQDESGFYFKPPREPPSFIFPLLSHRGRFEGERQCSPARWYLDSASAYIIDFVVSNSSGVDSTDEGSDGHRWSTSIEITRYTVTMSISFALAIL
ncbi:hypothetical protein MD484_g4843, partial [Candolleomyces efflorescens]